ncbi:MAG: hypothetical protein RIR60_1097 [Pseudomonadota bacterium]
MPQRAASSGRAMLRIGIVAGEASGDMLGGLLMQALKNKRSDIEFVGIAGPKMMQEGAQSLFPIERLSVRGYLEVIKHAFGLMRIRQQLIHHFLNHRVDIFIGIDAPDFNLYIEKRLKKHGIQTIHYVSPSIWAWRKNRLNKIKRAVSHILTLFPFEYALYQEAGVPVSFVGHPLADALPMQSDTATARATLRLKPSDLVVAMLPGSRQSEVQQHAALFIQTAKKLHADYPNALFLVPFVTRESKQIFELALFHEQEPLPIKILFGHAHDAMQASDVVIVASGTATLEAALLKKPMVITYRMPILSWWILRRMLLQPYVGLPNVLAGKFIVPELLQHNATPEKLAQAAIKLISDTHAIEEMKAEFNKIHLSLKQNNAEKASSMILADFS